MRPRTFFITSILLLVVTALPTANPRSWQTYGIRKIVSGYPPFPPPDIGPLDLPKDYFKDYPDLTPHQIKMIKQKNLRQHKRHQQEIEKQWRETGKYPTDQELDDRAREIKEMLRETCSKEQERTSVPAFASRRLEAQIQEKTERLARERIRDNEDRNVVKESERALQDAETVMKERREEFARILTQIERLKAQRRGLEEDSQEYRRIGGRIQALEARIMEVYAEQRQAYLTAQRARKKTGEAKARMKTRPQKIKQTEAEIQKLTDDLEALWREANAGWDPDPGDQAEDGNNLSINALENISRQWIQGVGTFLQDVNRRVFSTKGGDFRLPLSNPLPKPGLIGG